MQLTEEEARTKWCHRTGTFEAAGKCIASDCMAWRWANKMLGHDPKHKGEEAAKRFTKENPLKGFCGLVAG